MSDLHGGMAILHEGDTIVEFKAFSETEAYINTYHRYPNNAPIKVGSITTTKDQLLRVMSLLFPQEKGRHEQS